jgi:hygromycin-B 4-O-kinase
MPERWLSGSGALARWLSETFGPIEPLRPHGSGQEASTFLTSAAGEGELIVQVRRSAVEVEREKFVLATLQPQVPLATILLVTSLHDATVVVSRRLPGEPLEDLRADDLQCSLGPTVAALDAIHATSIAQTTGFGPFDGSGRGSYESWHQWLISVVPPARHEVRHPDLMTILDGFERTVPACPERRQLVHGDFGANNVLWDGARLGGVLDWENALFGDARYDDANVLYWAPWLECMHDLATLLEKRLGVYDHKALLAYQLRIGLHEMVYNERRGDAEMVGWSAARCRQLLSDG